MQGVGNTIGDLLRGQRHDDAGPPLHPRPAEQLVDDLIDPRLDARVALQHRFGLDAQQLGRAIQRDDDVLADPPRTALGAGAHTAHRRSAVNVTTTERLPQCGEPLV